MNYYTYAYLREDRTPYYIGKGKEDRIKSKQRSIKPPKDKSRIIFLKQNLTEEEAFKHEIYMIAVFGRIDLGTGILHNRTNGGEGASGFIHTPETRAKMSAERKSKTHSPEHRAKISATQKGKTHSPETKAKMSAANKGENNPSYGKSPSPETRAKMSAAQKGKTLSPETRAKISAAKKNITPETRSKMSTANRNIISS